MESFGTWRKWKLIFLFVNTEFYRVVWTINALLTVRSEMLPFSGNNQNITLFGVPSEHFAIGYVHNDNVPLGNIALQYVIPNIIAGRSDGVFWCFPALSKDQENFLLQIHQNYLVALKVEWHICKTPWGSCSSVQTLTTNRENKRTSRLHFCVLFLNWKLFEF